MRAVEIIFLNSFKMSKTATNPVINKSIKNKLLYFVALIENQKILKGKLILICGALNHPVFVLRDYRQKKSFSKTPTDVHLILHAVFKLSNTY